MKIKQLLCSHRWEILYKPYGGKAIVKCTKCHRVQYKKESNKNIVPKTYYWCPYCGYDLAKDSFVNQSNEGVAVYRCNNCKRKSKWHFGIAPIPVLLSNEKAI